MPGKRHKGVFCPPFLGGDRVLLRTLARTHCKSGCRPPVQCRPSWYLAFFCIYFVGVQVPLCNLSIRFEYAHLSIRLEAGTFTAPFHWSSLIILYTKYKIWGWVLGSSVKSTWYSSKGLEFPSPKSGALLLLVTPFSGL